MTPGSHSKFVSSKYRLMMDIPMPPIMEKVDEAVRSTPQERVRKRTVELFVPRIIENIEEVVQTVNPCKIVQRSRSRR